MRIDFYYMSRQRRRRLLQTRCVFPQAKEAINAITEVAYSIVKRL